MTLDEIKQLIGKEYFSRDGTLVTIKKYNVDFGNFVGVDKDGNVFHYDHDLNHFNDSSKSLVLWNRSKE